MYEEYQTVVKRSIVESRAGLVEPTEPARDEAEETVLHEEDDKVDLEAADAEEESVLAAETGPEPDTEQIEEDDEAVETPGEPEPVAPKAVMTADIVADAKVLRTFLEQVEAVTDEAKVRLEPDGIHVTAVDPAHVQLVEITLPLDSLEQYRVFEDGRRAVSPCDLGLDVEKLLGVLRKLKGKVSLAFRFGGVPNERLEVTQGGSSREMGLVDTAGMTDPRVPDLNFPAKVALDGKSFLDVLKDAGEVSDHLAVTVTPTALRFEAEGDVDRYRHEFPAGTDAVEYVTTVTEDYRSLFPLDYLVNIAKTVRQSRLVLWLGTDFPLRIDWDGETRGTFLTAPRIEQPD